MQSKVAEFLVKRIFTVLFVSIIAVNAQQSAANLRNEIWLKDIDFYAEQLPKRHKNLFSYLSKEDFEKQIKLLKNSVSKLRDDEISLELMKLTVQVNDGHTRVYWQGFNDRTTFPIVLRKFTEGYFVIQTVPENKEIIGKKLIKIGKIRIEEAEQRLRKVFAAENEFGVKQEIVFYLNQPFVLKAGNITASDAEAEFTFADSNGKTQKIKLKAKKFTDFSKAEKVNAFSLEKTPTALKNQDKNYWFEYLQDQKTLYLAYNRCQNDKSKSFQDFVKDVFAFVDQNEVKKFVVDLRRNGGGNSLVFFPLMDELKKRPQLIVKGKLFALISPQTFSSAFINALNLRQFFGAIWIGEPSAQAPVGYGEVKFFELPNSKIIVQYSTAKFEYVENEKRDFIPVDIEIKENFTDYANGIDKTLESVFNYQEK